MGTIIFGGNFMAGEQFSCRFPEGAICLSNYPRVQLSSGAIIFGDNCPVGNYLGDNHPGGNNPGDNFPRG